MKKLSAYERGRRAGVRAAAEWLQKHPEFWGRLLRDVAEAMVKDLDAGEG